MHRKKVVYRTPREVDSYGFLMGKCHASLGISRMDMLPLNCDIALKLTLHLNIT